MLDTEKLLKILDGKDRICKSPEEFLRVTSFDEGIAIWDAVPVKEFFYEKSMKWTPHSEIAVFIPCSAWKPYPYSQTHKFGYLQALRALLDSIDLFVVSEPMGIVPYFYSDEYPVNSYDYDPYKFFIGKLHNPKSKESLDIFVERVGSWIEKYHDEYKKRTLILPKSWHLKVFTRALSKVSVPLDQYQVIALENRPSSCVSFMQKQLERISLY